MTARKEIEEISKIATSVLEKHSVTKAPPVDIDLIIESYGINLIPLSGLRRLTSLSGALSSDFKSIYFDEEESDRFPFRMRFTLAHEFSHFILHKDLIKSTDLKGVPLWKEAFHRVNKYHYIETEANNLASFLLVPKTLLEKAIVDYDGDVFTMHKIFEVSSSCMEIRKTNFKFYKV